MRLIRFIAVTFVGLAMAMAFRPAAAIDAAYDSPYADAGEQPAAEARPTAAVTADNARPWRQEPPLPAAAWTGGAVLGLFGFAALYWGVRPPRNRNATAGTDAG